MTPVRSLAALFLLGCTFSVAEEQPRRTPCEEIQDLPETLNVVSCEAVDPSDYEIDIFSYDACFLPRMLGKGDKRTVLKRVDKDNQLNPRLIVSLHGKAIDEWVLEPQTIVRPKGGITRPAMVCDSLGRIYVVHKTEGFIVALRHHLRASTGLDNFEEIWRHQLPGFSRLEATPSVEKKRKELEKAGPVTEIGLHVMEMIGILDKEGSIVQQLFPLDGGVIVEYKTALDGFTHVVYSSWGEEIATFGPWEAVLLDVDGDKIQFGLGGGTDLPLFAPSHVAEVRVRPTEQAQLLHHGLAWLMPRPMNRDFALTDCLSRPEKEISYWLKDDFEQELSVQARDAIRSLGRDWLSELQDKSMVRRQWRSARPHDPAWQASYRQALLQAGVDLALLPNSAAPSESQPKSATP